MKQKWPIFHHNDNNSNKKLCFRQYPHHSRSQIFSRHYDKIINKDIIGFTETKINLSDSTCKINEALIVFNISFNNF